MIVVSTSLIPFLEMNGSANEAIDFYENALDAKVVYVLRFGDMPENPESPLPPEKKDWINYAILKIGDSELQITDHVTGSTYEKGTQITIVVQTNDKNKANQYFEVLKQGGQVNEPMQANFFSPAYGNVTDKFGITFRILTRGHQ
ncbi:MAG: VOC family protein [Candidatus Pristimantibacillus sp.]